MILLLKVLKDKYDRCVTVDSEHFITLIHYFNVQVYGCMRPEATDSMDMTSFQQLLAPKDVVQVSFIRKDNFHGIGYSGLDPTTAMFGSLANESRSFRPTGKEKRGIRGQVNKKK